MKWEELSLKDRAELMRIYLDNGISSIASIKKHYNSFADGGEVDNIHSTPAQDFVASWLSNRQEQFQENFRNSGSTMIPYSVLPKSWSNKAAFNEFQNQLENLRTVKQYDVLGNTKFPHIPDSEFEAIKKLSNHTGGAYNPATHSISYISPYAGTDVHELTHSLNANPQLNTIRYGFKGDKLQEGKQYNPYKDSADEIYSRLMQFRYLNKLDPKKKYTIDDIKKWRERYDDTDIINRYNDEYLLHLLNNVASTKSSIEKDGRKLAAYGGPLKDEYDNPDQYYDYITAEEAGGMYDEKSKHWASRDPRTGMILKNPKHPTFAQAIREDQSSGYAPFIDVSTGRYFTLRPEEYSTAPNKHTLRRANIFQTGEGKIIPDTPWRDYSTAENTPEVKIDRDRFIGIKTSNSRPYDPELISRIDAGLQVLNKKQRASIIGDIIEESGGNPFAKSRNGTYQGLLQWEDGRYTVPDYGPIPTEQDTITELNNQLSYIKKSIRNTKDRKSWTHGGEGSHFKTGQQAHDTFWDNNIPVDSIHRAFSFGYVRPAGKEHSYKNRQKVVNQVLNKINKK